MNEKGKQTLRKLKHIGMVVVAGVIPLSIWRKLYRKQGNLSITKLLCIKGMQILAKKEISHLVDGNKYMVFDEDIYTYKVFNMCYMSNILGKALLATTLGAVPVFRIVDADGDNYFLQFFDEIIAKGQEVYSDKIYAYSKKAAPGIRWDMSSTERIAYQKLYEKYFVLKSQVKAEYDAELEKMQRIIGSDDSVGIVLRGTDYVLTKPKGHPIQPDIEEIVDILEKEFPEAYYYVATDEERLLNLLKDKFGDRVITSDSVYFDGIYEKDDKRISYISFDRENDKYLRGFEYFRKLYVMSKLNNVVFGMSGASRMVLIMRSPGFDKERIIYHGLY
ncbi:hypothetical protein [Butyrivibrio sp. JL13D10]|uniref:hypothetical protein n=1 Tax=Butyrivibrio sp. JL13D10 TaxID=3236815 RepID=UPI0038B48CA0